MKLIRVAIVASLAGLGGCMVVPVSPGYNQGSPGYYAPAPVYAAPTVYFGPSFGFGIFGGGRGHDRGHRHR